MSRLADERSSSHRARRLTWLLAIGAAFVAAVVLHGATGASVNQKVKTTAPYQLFSEDGYLWTFGWTRQVTGFVPQSPPPNISPLASDPRVRTPDNSVLSANACWGALASNGTQVGMEFFMNYRSLLDAGNWTVVCNGIHVDPAQCTATNPPCTPTCLDTASFTAWQNPFTWSVRVFNDPPSVTLGHSPTPAWNAAVTLSATGSDPDGGPLTFRWSTTAHPAGSTATLASTTSSTPIIQFNGDQNIGHWAFQLDVDDDEGERRTLSRAFDVPNVVPTISVANAGDIDALTDIAPVATATDPDGHTPTVSWDIVSSPSGSLHGPQSGVATTASFPPIVTTESAPSSARGWRSSCSGHWRCWC